MDFSPALDRVPPQALASEQAVLGCVLVAVDRGCIEAAREVLHAEDFYQPSHRRIFEACCRLDDCDKPADLLTVEEELARAGFLETAGGAPYLLACVKSVPSASRLRTYAEEVRLASIRRQLITAGGEIIGAAWDYGREVPELIEEAERLIFAIGKRQNAGGVVHVREVLAGSYEEITSAYETGLETTGVGTGFKRLDGMTGGLQKGDLVVVAGRPGMGKSAIAMNIAVHAAKAGTTALAFSLEMSAKSLGHRLISAEAKVDSSRLRTGQVGNAPGYGDEWEDIARSIASLSALPLYIDESSDLKLLEARSKARRLQSETGLGLIILDYLQLMARDARPEHLRTELGRLTGGFKAIAKELGIPVIVLSQLNREPEKRKGNRPMLSDLSESGAIEADADVVLFPFRPAYYDREEKDDERIRFVTDTENAEIIVAKHRNGPTGIVPVSFIGRYGMFADCAACAPPAGGPQ